MSVGQHVSITYSSDRAGEVHAALVVGADGRSSTIRRQADISLPRDPPINYIAGLLVDGLAGIPRTCALASQVSAGSPVMTPRPGS